MNSSGIHYLLPLSGHASADASSYPPIVLDVLDLADFARLYKLSFDANAMNATTITLANVLLSTDPAAALASAFVDFDANIAGRILVDGELPEYPAEQLASFKVALLAHVVDSVAWASAPTVVVQADRVPVGLALPSADPSSTKSEPQSHFDKLQAASSTKGAADKKAFDDARAAVRKSIASVLQLSSLFARAADKVKASPAAISVLKQVCCLSDADRIAFMSAIVGSAIGYAADDLPLPVLRNGVVDNTARNLALDHALKNYVKNEKIEELVSSVPNINTALKNFSSEQEKRDNPLTLVLNDNTASGTAVVIANDVVIPITTGKVVAQNYMAEAAAYENVMRNVSSRYAGSFSQEDVDVLNSRNVYIDSKHAPSYTFTRFTLKFAITKGGPPLQRDIDGVVMYSLKDGSKGEKTEKQKGFKLSGLPLFGYGGDKTSVYSVLQSTDGGKEVIKQFTTLFDRDVVKCDVNFFKEFLSVYSYAMSGLGSKSQPPSDYTDIPDAGGVVSRYANHTAALVKFTTEKLDIILKVLSNKQGLRIMIQDQIALGGVYYLPAVAFLCTKLGVGGGAVTEAVTVNCHGIIKTLKYFRIAATDGNDGQLINCTDDPHKGQFEPGVIRLGLTHTYLKDEETTILDKVKGVIYKREGSFDLELLKDRVLIDLTIPGYGFNPQQQYAYKTGVDFKGHYVLHDTKDSTCLYNYNNLRGTKGFIVYSSLADWNNDVRVRQLTMLHKTHVLTVSPTIVTSFLGVYLVGVRRDCMVFKTDESEVKLSTIRSAAAAMNFSKMALFGDLYDKVPKEYAMMFNVNSEFLPRLFPEFTKDLQLGIGSQAAYKYLVKKGKKVTSQVEIGPHLETFAKNLASLGDSKYVGTNTYEDINIDDLKFDTE